jgi:Family of unknown function (DUF6114)
MTDSLSKVRHIFRIWRGTRPFWGGLLVLGGACEILTSEQGPIALVVHIGIQGLAGYLIPMMLLLCGILLWFNPAQRAFYSLLAIVLALGSWITSNLGGFFIGMLLSLVGGALAFAWTTGSDRQALRWFPGNPQILQPSWGLELVYRPTPALAPPAPARAILVRGYSSSGEQPPDSANDPGPDDLGVHIAEIVGTTFSSGAWPPPPAAGLVSDIKDSADDEPATSGPDNLGNFGPFTSGF